MLVARLSWLVLAVAGTFRVNLVLDSSNLRCFRWCSIDFDFALAVYLKTCRLFLVHHISPAHLLVLVVLLAVDLVLVVLVSEVLRRKACLQVASALLAEVKDCHSSADSSDSSDSTLASVHQAQAEALLDSQSSRLDYSETVDSQADSSMAVACILH